MVRRAPRATLLRFGIGATVLAVAAAAVNPRAGIGVVALSIAIAGGWAILNYTTCDPVSLLTFYLIFLFGVPSVYVFKALGAVGTPAILVALVGAGWWGAARLSLPQPSSSGFQPIRLVVGAFVSGMVLTWGLGFTRVLEPAQARSADRSLIGTIALGGIALLAADCIASRSRLETLLLRLVDAGTFLACLGILQFATGLNPAKFLRLPGLRLNSDLTSISLRSTVRRVSGTALHGIEFGVVLAIILPIALHYAFSATRNHRLRRWGPVTALIIAIPMSVSRSALVGLVAVGAMLIPTWSSRRRANVIAVLFIGAFAMRAIVPGLLGTLKSLVTGASQDSSVTHRTQSTTLVFARFVHSPWFGQGFGTYIPQEVRFLDNQYFGTLVETGLAGLVLLTAMLGCAMAVAKGARKRSADAETRSLGQSLAASILVAIFTFGTFDALGFPINAGLVFLIIGCIGALWRLVDEERPPHQRFPASAGRATARRPNRNL